MISVITCSRTPVLSSVMQANIAETVGVEYELVTIDNSKSTYSIFQAYNRGIELAKGDIFCFVHDDVLFRTEGWGKIVEAILQDSTIGQIGFAGCHYLPKSPAYWSDSLYVSFCNINNDKGNVSMNESFNYFHNDIAEVAVIDGAYMFFPSSVFKKVKFDDTTFSGFHFYDMDISMQIQQLNLKVIVTKKILIEHFWSDEKFDSKTYTKQFKENKVLFFNKWKDSLPITRGIKLSPLEISIAKNVYKYKLDYINIYNSLAYRLGKCILHPNAYTIRRLFRPRETDAM